MKVLFAISNEEVSESIVKKYQIEYKQIISSKNVYYFNAILKEIQKDKTYDRIVISEDLEAYANQQYDQIDKFIFDRLDSISDEASNVKGKEIPIILICSDRRTKSEETLVKLFGIGIYNALIGTDRNVEDVCKLLNRPRTKKEAKDYYKIDSEEVNYSPEKEDDVSEVEIQNILAHYKKLGKNEQQYVASFDNIAAQYNEKQLRVIAKVLPLNVKAVLEEKSPKYQRVMSFNNTISSELRKPKGEDGPTSRLLQTTTKRPKPMSGSVVIPSEVNMNEVKKLAKHKTTVNMKPIGQRNQQPTQIPMQQQVQAIGQRNQQPTQTPMQQQAQTIGQRSKQPTQIPIQQQVQSNQQQKHIQHPTIQEHSYQGEGVNIVENRQTTISKQKETPIEPIEPPKKRRGRPPKAKPVVEEIEQIEQPTKRKRGRPPKNRVEVNTYPKYEESVETTLPGFEDTYNQPQQMEENTNSTLPGFDFEEETNYVPSKYEEPVETTLPGFEDTYNQPQQMEENTNSILPGFEDAYNQPQQMEENTNSVLPDFNFEEDTNNTLGFEEDNTQNYNNNYEVPSNANPYQFEKEDQLEENTTISGAEEYSNNSYQNPQEYVQNNISTRREYVNTKDLSAILKQGKKVVSFLGTSKNGTSFIVNNLAEIASSMGIKTAILDTTTNRNAYYIYTKNEEALREIALTSIDKLANGETEGIQVNKNLTVFTSLPNDEDKIDMVDEILETLINNYSLILIDTDFNTSIGYFKQAQEIYLVQSLDVLTIQPLTAFLRSLKAKDALDESKIRIIINKAVKVKGISDKTIIGGMAYYTDPAMSYMTELFDRNTVKYITIPFEEETYIRYLEGLINCEISLKGYSKIFMQSLKELANMVYPLQNANQKTAYRPPQAYGRNGEFSPSINNTLNQMKRNY